MGCLPSRATAQHTEAVATSPSSAFLAANGDDQVLRVRRSEPLQGTVRVAGAKNSVLKIMAASLLCPGHYTLRNVPRIADVRWMGELLERMGAATHQQEDVLTIDIPEKMVTEAPYDLVERMRASIAVLGLSLIHI